MRKTELIAAIRRMNQTAQERFLKQFDEKALRLYLSHLQEKHVKHVRKTEGLAKVG